MEVGMVPLPKSSMETEHCGYCREVCDAAAEAQWQTEIELALNEEVHIVLCSASKSNLLDLRGL